MRLVCVACSCEMIEVCSSFSTRPAYWVCPICKYKVKNADYTEQFNGGTIMTKEPNTQNEKTIADEEVNASILIREDDGEWREPLVEE